MTVQEAYVAGWVKACEHRLGEDTLMDDLRNIAETVRLRSMPDAKWIENRLLLRRDRQAPPLLMTGAGPRLRAAASDAGIPSGPLASAWPHPSGTQYTQFGRHLGLSKLTNWPKVLVQDQIPNAIEAAVTPTYNKLPLWMRKILRW